MPVCVRSHCRSASASGPVVVSVSHGGATDSLELSFVRPIDVSLSAADPVLSAIGCGEASSLTAGYQSTQLRLTVDGLEMTDLSTYSSSDESVLRVEGSRVVGVGPGFAQISAAGSIASVGITVEDIVMQPILVARIVTALGSDARAQIFDSEDDFGFMYVYANYSNGDTHTLAATSTYVNVSAPEKVSYTRNGERQRVGVVQDALASSSCREQLLRVSLQACDASEGSTFEPPFNLNLPLPLGLKPLVLSRPNIAPPNSFARSAALSSRPGEWGTITQIKVEMSEGGDKNMLGDERVSLSSSDPSCVEVVADLTSSAAWDYIALDGGTCTGATITATVTLGAWSESVSTTVHIVRYKSMSITPALYPSCSGSPTTLYTLGCRSPPLRQRVQFSASYLLESNDAGYSQSGGISLSHDDVNLVPSNLNAITPPSIYEGSVAGAASMEIRLKGESATVGITISDTALALSMISPSVGTTLITSLTVSVGATFSGQGLNCPYGNGHVRNGALGTTIEDVALFNVPAPYDGAILSVSTSGTLTALASHWAQAPVRVTNKCETVTDTPRIQEKPLS